jgi:hypothetical protein
MFGRISKLGAISEETGIISPISPIIPSQPVLPSGPNGTMIGALRKKLLRDLRYAGVSPLKPASSVAGSIYGPVIGSPRPPVKT